MTENYRESFADVPVGGIGMVYDGDSLFKPMDVSVFNSKLRDP